MVSFLFLLKKKMDYLCFAISRECFFSYWSLKIWAVNFIHLGLMYASKAVMDPSQYSKEDNILEPKIDIFFTINLQEKWYLPVFHS